MMNMTLNVRRIHREAASVSRLCGIRLAILAAMPMIALTGCGYTHGSAELYSDAYHTVAVPIFENRTFTRGVQFQLNEALIKEIQTRTPYAIRAPAGAETVLQGTVTAVDRAALSRRREGGLPQEMEIAIRVDFQWKDLRTGEVLRGRRGFESVGTYLPASPMGEPESIAIQTAVDRLAQDIVGTLQSDWNVPEPAQTAAVSTDR